MAGRKGMPRASRTELAARIERVIAMRERGMTYKQIGEAEGVTANAINNLMHRHAPNRRVVYEKVCALVECDARFTTTDPRKLYCNHLHSKRGSERSRRGNDARYLPCRLPECDELVLVVGSSDTSQRYCSKLHGGRHLQRLASGYYDKLVDRTACVCCGWWGPGLEQHHIKPKHKGGSDHPSNLAWVCQNCHTLIHSGLATLNHRREFVDLREEMRDRELARRKQWGEQ